MIEYGFVAVAICNLYWWTYRLELCLCVRERGRQLQHKANGKIDEVVTDFSEYSGKKAAND